MITTQETLARPVLPGNAATAIFTILGLIDVALTAVIGSSGAPPLIVSLGVIFIATIGVLVVQHYQNEKAYDERSGFLTSLAEEPKWDGLRSNQRFRDLVKKVGFI